MEINYLIVSAIAMQIFLTVQYHIVHHIPVVYFQNVVIICFLLFRQLVHDTSIFFTVACQLTLSQQLDAFVPIQ